MPVLTSDGVWAYRGVGEHNYRILLRYTGSPILRYTVAVVMPVMTSDGVWEYRSVGVSEKGGNGAGIPG